MLESTGDDWEVPEGIDQCLTWCPASRTAAEKTDTDINQRDSSSFL